MRDWCGDEAEVFDLQLMQYLTFQLIYTGIGKSARAYVRACKRICSGDLGITNASFVERRLLAPLKGAGSQS